MVQLRLSDYVAPQKADSRALGLASTTMLQTGASDHESAGKLEDQSREINPEW
jgi:hypothetical protein